MAQAPVGVQGGTMEYGIVIYDIPTRSKRLYYRVHSRIRRRALQMNLSVYLFSWGQRDQLDDLIKEAEADTGQKATFNILKFDTASEEKIREIAVQCLVREIGETARRIKARVNKAREKYADIPDRSVRNFERRLEIAEGLALVFGLTTEIQDAMAAGKQIFQAEMDALKAMREELKGGKAGGQGQGQAGVP